MGSKFKTETKSDDYERMLRGIMKKGNNKWKKRFIL